MKPTMKNGVPTSKKKIMSASSAGMGTGVSTKRIGGHHGGTDAMKGKINNIDDQRGILNNSDHAIYKRAKGKM